MMKFFGIVFVLFVMVVGSVEASDFNGDGKSDILFHEPATGQNYIMLMNGAMVLSSSFSLGLNASWSVAGSGDFNGDGKSDILFHKDSTGQNYVMLMNGQQVLLKGFIAGINSSWSVAGVGDFNGDGLSDIFYHQNSTGLNYMMLMNGLNVLSAGFTPLVNPSWQVSGVGDFNGDGMSDILFHRKSSGQNYIMLMAGMQVMSKGFASSVNNSWSIAGVSDFNADGMSDILFHQVNSGRNYIMLMNGIISVSAAFTDFVASSWKVAKTADFDGDGKGDVLFHQPITGQNYLMLMNGLVAGNKSFVKGLQAKWKVLGNGGITVSTVSTVAGSSPGLASGIGRLARFNSPEDITIDDFGNIYVADKNNSLIRKITVTGKVSTLAGGGGVGTVGSTQGTRFSFPAGVTVDATGNVYVADQSNNRIRKVTPTSTVFNVAGNGLYAYADGQGAAASFNMPSGVAIDNVGNFIVADQHNHRVRMVTAAGKVSTLAGNGIRGNVDGTANSASFNMPTDVVVDAAGNIYVADMANQSIRKISLTGFVSTFAGGVGSQFNQPAGLAIDGNGDLYVADRGNHSVFKISSLGVVSRIAGGGVAGSADGLASVALFNTPTGIDVDAVGNIYVADSGNHRVRKITP